MLSAPASVAAALTDGSGAAAAAGEAEPGVTEYEYLRALNESLMDQMDASVTRSHLRPLPPHARFHLRPFGVSCRLGVMACVCPSDTRPRACVRSTPMFPAQYCGAVLQRSIMAQYCGGA